MGSVWFISPVSVSVFTTISLPCFLSCVASLCYLFFSQRNRVDFKGEVLDRTLTLRRSHSASSLLLTKAVKKSRIIIFYLIQVLQNPTSKLKNSPPLLIYKLLWFLKVLCAKYLWYQHSTHIICSIEKLNSCTIQKNVAMAKARSVGRKRLKHGNPGWWREMLL